MKEFSNEHGTCFLNEDGIFFVNGKEKFINVGNVYYKPYKRNTYVYIYFKKGFYKVYSLKENRVLLNKVTKIIYSTKSIIIVTFCEENKEKYYVFDLIDESKSRYIKKWVNYVILEEDCLTLTYTKGNKNPITLPEKCKDLCAAKEIIDFYAITQNNEILILAPYPYNFSENSNLSKPLFWEFKDYVKYKILKILSFKALTDFIFFKNEDEKKLFVLVSFLYEYKLTNEKIYIENINKILSEKQITFKYARYHITLTLNKLILKDKFGKVEYDYNIFEYSEFYLQNLISYHLVRDIENKIKSFALDKLSVEEILENSDFSGNKELLKRFLYNLNCNPNSNIFYIINNHNRVVMTKRKSLVESIKNALISGKNFIGIMNRYDLNPHIIKKMLKSYYNEEYIILKKQKCF